MMTTPIADFLARYAASGTARLHMPGHKGKAPYPPLDSLSRWDITEITGADALFEAEGIIGQSEENAARLYGSGFSCYSAGGSTLCIQAMLAAACRPGGKVVAGRNAHAAFLNACALLDLDPVWILPDYNDAFGVSGTVPAEAVEAALAGTPDAQAVYLTSPDYFGAVSDIAALAAVCHARGVPLLVDGAHGAHLRFCPEDRHPLTLGADLCCDSWHKTLPALTGGACLHAAKGSPYRKEKIKARMAMFGSTSPSYLILLSLDLCCRWLAEEGREAFAALEKEQARLTALAAGKGFAPFGEKPDFTKLTLDGYDVGWTGERLAAHFRQMGVEYEYASERHVVLMLSPQNSPEEIRRAEAAIAAVEPEPPLPGGEERFVLPERAMQVREAAFAPAERVPVEAALGRVGAGTVIRCPPGVPILAAGERIDARTQKLLKRSSIAAVNVVK